MNESRIEKKFTFNKVELKNFLTELKLLPNLFVKTHSTRKVNSLYFDTPDFSNARDHINGVLRRSKIRIRWYEDLNPVLELKIKHGESSKKILKVLVPESLDLNSNLYKNLQAALLGIPEYKNVCAGLVPTVFITYERTYYESADKRLRLTLDQQICFYKADKEKVLWESKRCFDNCVVEFKFEFSDKSIVSELPFSFIKFSKYLNSLQRVHNDLI